MMMSASSSLGTNAKFSLARMDLMISVSASFIWQPQVWMNTFFDVTFCVVEDCIILNCFAEVYIKLTEPMNECDVNLIPVQAEKFIIIRQ